MNAKWIRYGGMSILYLDCRGLQPSETVAVLDEAARELSTAPGKARVLANVENVYLTREFMDHMKELGRTVFAERVERTAIVGVTGVKNVLLQAYNFFTKRSVVPFDHEEQALDWLTGHP